MRILAVDLGEKRVGLAISDPLGLTAQGLETFERRSDRQSVDHILRICGEKQVDECIVGLPLRMSGEEGDRAKRTRNWVAELEKRAVFPVKTWDERLSTREATRLLIRQNQSRKKQKERNDQLAAILILQNYMEFRRSSSGLSDLPGGDADLLQ